MRTRLVSGLLLLGLLGTTPAEAQRFSCGGHRIQWIGGAPAASADTAGERVGAIGNAMEV